jgi:hypothetical protein
MHIVVVARRHRSEEEGMMDMKSTTTTPLKSSRFMPASPRRKRASTASNGDSSITKQQQPATFLVLEEVDTNYTLEDAIKDTANPISVCDFFLIVIQVAYALKLASEKISFTHYDLHPRNILLRKIEGLSSSAGTLPLKKDSSGSGGDYAYIPYERGNVFIAAKFVASFTEFGFSHMSAVNSQNRSVSFGFSAKGRAELVELGISEIVPIQLQTYIVLL